MDPLIFESRIQNFAYKPVLKKKLWQNDIFYEGKTSIFKNRYFPLDQMVMWAEILLSRGNHWYRFALKFSNFKANGLKDIEHWADNIC